MTAEEDAVSSKPGETLSGDSLQTDGGSDKVYLRRQVTILDGVALTVGVIIGSGIFISPSGILRFTGSVGWSLVVWVFCGLLSMLGALSYAELGTTFPISGGSYAYILETYGPLPAFLLIFNGIVASATGGVSVLGIAFASYILLPIYPECQDSYSVTRLLAAAIICFSAFINCYSVPFARGLNIFFLACKIIGLLVIIGFGIAALVNGTGDVSHFENAFEGPTFETFPLAVYAGLFAYAGWQSLFVITEEVVRPSRTIPISIITSILLVTVVYLLANIAYFVILSPSEILLSNAIALDFARQVMGNWWWTVSIVVSLSIAGSLTGTSLSRARLFYVASREGHIPEIVSMIHIDKKTPLPAACLTVPFSLLLLLSDDVYSLINYVGVTGWLFSAITVAIVPYYRWKFPDLKRPFKVPLIIPIIYCLCCFFVVGMSLYSSPVDCGIGVAITLSGVPVYFIAVKWRNKPQWVDDSLDKMTTFLQQLLYVVPQEDLGMVDELRDNKSTNPDNQVKEE